MNYPSMQQLIRLVFMHIMAVWYGVCVLFVFAGKFLTGPRMKWKKVKRRDFPPKCLDDPDFTHNYIYVNEVKLHFVEAGDPKKPLMLFVHGFPEFWFSWRNQIKEFLHNYRCVAFDMRGYGMSDKPEDCCEYHIQTLVEDLRQLIMHLEHKKCVLVGHDWGGAICWVLLEKYPHLVHRYIMINAPHFKAFRQLLEHNKKQQAMSWYISFFQLPYLPEFTLRCDDLEGMVKLFSKFCTEEEIEAYKYTFGQKDAFTPPLNYYRNLPYNRIETEKKLTEHHPPGVFIFGENDQYLHKDMLDITVKLIPNLTAKLIKDAGHFIQQEKPDEVNRIMREFLENNPL